MRLQDRLLEWSLALITLIAVALASWCLVRVSDLGASLAAETAAAACDRAALVEFKQQMIEWRKENAADHAEIKAMLRERK